MTAKPGTGGGLEMTNESVFDAVRISERVHWVGAIDWGLRDFHGYHTVRGSTYNAYLITAEDVILVDTVKAPFKDELLQRVASVTDPTNIRYLISNHAEMDHTGSLPQVLAEVEPEKVYASRMGVKALSDHFHMDREIVPVSDGDRLQIGGVDLTFLETKMLHWPDSMVTYLAEDKLLFSQDGFGMHLATSERFADEIDECLRDQEAAKYFANILLPYSQLILKLLDRIGELPVEIDILAPDHGPVYRKDLGWIFDRYAGWASQKPRKKAVIVYDTMWGSTGKMAKAIGEGLLESGISVKEMPLESNHRSDVVTEVLTAGALVVGSPTINNNLFPSMADVLTYLKGLKPRNLVGAAFGSYGWSGESTKYLAEYLEEMKVESVAEPLKVKYVPDAVSLAECRQLGREVAERLEEVAGG
jgi:flavorubredoxin